MHRFYLPHPNFSSSEIFLTDRQEIHHLRDVLRLKENDSVCVFNGQGEEAQGMIEAILPQKVSIKVQSFKKSSVKIPYTILACALPKKGKFELIIEKVTELGIDEIIPMVTKRTEIILSKERALDKLTRFRMVAMNAAKQSQRSTLPVISPVISFQETLEVLAKTTTAFIPSLFLPRENIFTAFGKIHNPQKISFLVGPEGDFTDEEYLEAQEKGCIPVSLGENILKVETAAICTVACAKVFYANIKK